MDEVQRLLDQLVAAGAPGAAGWVEDERGSLGAASGLADLEGGRPMEPGLRFRAGSAWSYSNTGYILLGLVVEAVTGRTLAEELDRGILRPLGLRHSLLPGSGPGIPPPRSSGYSLPLGPPGQVADGPLQDVTAYDPSSAWAVSTLGDLTRFFRALHRDGRRQLGVMVNVLAAPDPVYEAFIKGFQALGVRLLSGERP
jgi:CubicO group peptidase (beta-lactamase class C family)